MTLTYIQDQLDTFITNVRHHRNTQAFINAFWPALGWSLGLTPLALVISWSN